MSKITAPASLRGRACGRAIRRKAAAWRRTARKLVTAMLVAASALEAPQHGLAQIGGLVGQGAMSPSGGLVSSGIARFRELDANGPGWMYWGVNAADRGLGYRGSYMTLGGFIPYAEDDLGGLWSADLRSHLSNYGGFFSNIGAVRKQFVGGTILGVGVYWDYDGDQNQYSDTTITDTSGSYVFAGGQSYSQIGVSGEWLTDYGNLRSNGYIPVGTTAQTMGPFVGNSLLCTPGINAALAGTDLEVGAYVPGLSDWAGMISVGGYAFGNSRYDLVNGQAVVPWFGGVYTRLDLTLLKNWDFSLQYNNDSYFDSTGFARLTYRMGGSRRRNVPDQMEQPMMRNEHIVRAHQVPEQAINPYTSSPWRVIHVDNSTTDAPQGNGTAASPFTRLASSIPGTPNANAAATRPYDIVYVHQGNSLNSPYLGPFTFNQSNQYLVGEGTSLRIPTVSCGFVQIGATSDRYPVISTLPGTGNAAIRLSGAAQATNIRVSHLAIVGADFGITDGDGLATNGIATIDDVRITGNGPGQTGVLIRDINQASGTATNATFNFSRMALTNLTADGFVIDGQDDAGVPIGNPNVNISNSTIKNTSGSAIIVNATNGEGRLRLADSQINGTTGPGVLISGANAVVESSSIANVGTFGVQVTGAPTLLGVSGTSGTSTVQVTNSEITAEIGVLASAAEAGELVNITINQNTLNAPTGGNGISLAVGGTTPASSQGSINANLVGNTINARPTSAVTTGTAGGITKPIFVNADIYLTTSSTAAGLGSISVKAASQDNLTALNRNASVITQPIFNPVNTGTSSPLVPPPPPPIYNPALTVPLPQP